MALRKFNPITPGMRHKVLSKFEEITTDKPHKPLLEPINLVLKCIDQMPTRQVIAG